MRKFIANQKQAWRALKTKPGLIFTVVVTMGITLGALLTVITLAWVLLVKPLPYPDAERLYQLNAEVSFKGSQRTAKAFAYPALIAMFEQQQQLQDAAMLTFTQDVLISHRLQPTLELGFATPTWFDLLKAPMQMGRRFSQTEGLNSNNPVAVISHQTWQQQFDGDQQILSQSIEFSGVRYRIIGVLAPDFVDPQLYKRGVSTDVWLPWDFNLQKHLDRNWVRLLNELMLVGKLTLNANVEQVEARLAADLNRLWLPNTDYSKRFAGAQVSASLTSFKNHILGDIASAVVLLLLGGVGLVLIATVNVANIFMSRTAEQQRVLAIRAAVGANPSHIFQMLLAESGLLMAWSVLLALPLAFLGITLLQNTMADIFPRVDELGLHPVTLIAALLSMVVFALVFCGFASRSINYRALNMALRSSGKGTGIQVSKKVRTGLIFMQVALATGLIFANGLLFVDAYQKIKQPLGFELDNLTRLNLSFSEPRWPSIKQLTPIMDEIEQELRALPEVADVSRSYSPMSRYAVYNMEDLTTNQRQFVQYKMVSEDYFAQIKQPFIQGRGFTKDDQRQNNPVMVINQPLAQALAADGDISSVLGKQIKGRSKKPYTVIGIVQGIRLPGQTDIAKRAYVPAVTGLGSAMIRLQPEATLDRETIVNVVKKVDGRFSVGRLDSLKALEQQLLFPLYMTIVATGALALLSLFTAAVGLYGILSYSTQLRRTEFGTRMAIGANDKHLIKLVVADNLLPISAGMGFATIGLAIVYWFNRQSLGEYLGVDTPIIYGLTLALISAITFIACYLPLNRYLKRPAIYALRGE